ncbi:hypothetical protein [Alteromonas sp. H39]|uniref:hypothetical protein n=1 Tax=Alteromonas sp. H39 TaxID=3389876 RepID=UPI0039E00535
MMTSARRTTTLLSLSLILSACSATQPCEDILEVKRQEHQCLELARIMKNNEYPQQAMTARKRYETECEDLRYYRDEYDTICKGNHQPIGNRQTQPD